MTLSQSAIRALTCGLRNGAAANEIATAIDVVSAAGDVSIADATGLIVGHATQETVSNGDGTTDMIPELQVLGTTQADSSLLLGCFNTTNTIAATLAFAKGGNAAIGTHTTVADNEYLGRIIAFGDDGTDLESPAAEIRFVVDDTVATGNMGGSIEFYTTADGGETLTLAATINVLQNFIIANGNGLLVGHATPETVSNGDGATDLVPEVQILGTAQADSSLVLGCFNATDTIAATLAFVKGGNAAIGSHTAVADNEYVGRIIAFGDDGTDLETPIAEIRFVVDDAGTPGTSAIGGSIELYTTADGGTTLTKAVTVDTAQAVTCAGALSVTGVSTLTGNNLAITAGAGITGAADSFVSCVERIGTLYKTTIVIDVEGLNSGANANDVIGDEGAANCSLGQITAARNGTIFAGKMTCLEAPTGGDDDIDLWDAESGTLTEDTDIEDDTGAEDQLVNSGDWTLDKIVHLTAYPTANRYLYLGAGTGNVNDTYTAGKFLIELWGK